MGRIWVSTLAYKNWVGLIIALLIFRKLKNGEKSYDCVYLMIGLNSLAFGLLNHSRSTDSEIKDTIADFSIHQQWNQGVGWKNALNNLRLIIQPTILLWLISPWLEIFPNHDLWLEFHDLIQVMNQFKPYFPDG